MKPVAVFLAGLVLILFAGSAQAESRSVLIRIETGQDQKARVTIYSDEKAERKASISIAEAVQVIAGMKGWGSSVNVYLWTEGRLPHAAHNQLFQAIDDNPWLDLAFFGREAPKTIVANFIRERLEPAPEPREAGIYHQLHTRAELPTPGTMVTSPKDKDIVYYFTNRLRMWGVAANVGKHAGLYVSKDRGKTWRLRSNQYEFEKLFVHPDTNQLFAIITDDWLASDEKDGTLQHYYSNKVITSADGEKWKDITGERGHMADLLSIFPDPDHPGQVCLEANSIRDYVLQARDKNYTDWNWLRRIARTANACSTQ